MLFDSILIRNLPENLKNLKRMLLSDSVPA